MAKILKNEEILKVDPKNIHVNQPKEDKRHDALYIGDLIVDLNKVPKKLINIKYDTSLYFYFFFICILVIISLVI